MIAIVTDSSAYLTRQEARRMGVYMVPMSYTSDGHIFNETFVDGNGPFEKLVSSGRVFTTSQTMLSTFMSTFEELLQKGYDIICLTISSRLSGTYSSASIAKHELGSERIHLVDTRSVAGSAYLLVREAVELIASGLDALTIAEKLREMRESIGIVFSVSDMGPLRRSGRLGIVRQSVGTILNVRPMFQCVDGGVVSSGKARGRNELIRQMADCVSPNPKALIVHNIADQKAARLLCEELARRFPKVPLQMRSAGPVLGIHLGLGVCAVVWESMPE